MASNEIPLEEILEVGDERAEKLKVPQRFMVLPGHVNIQRIGSKAPINTYVCREDGCTWRKEAVPIRTARRHAESHGDKPCHIFEAVRRTEVLEQYAAKHRMRCKRQRDRLKAEQAKVPRHKRTRGFIEVSSGQRPRKEYQSGEEQDEEEKGDEEDEDEDHFQPARNFFPAVTDQDEGVMNGVVCFASPGRGAIRMPGRVGVEAREAVEVAVSWASTQVRALWHWLGRMGGSRRCPSLLWRSDETLVVGFANGYTHWVHGHSMGAAVALSLVSMLTRRPVDVKVAVTGVVDLSGNILHVTGLRAKLSACQKAGIETLLVPESSLADFSIESLPADLRNYAYQALRGVRTMADVIRLSIQDCPLLPVEMASVGLVPSVGLGYGICYENRMVEDSSQPIGRLVFEAVSRPCGSGKLIFTGSHGNQQLALMAEMAFTWAMDTQGYIIDEVGRRQGAAVTSTRRDIHLHLRNGLLGMVLPSFYCPAMGVALASLVSGLLPLEDIAVSGELTVQGEFLGRDPTLSEVEHVYLLYHQGFRRLLVGYEPSMETEVRSMVDRLGIRVEQPPEDDINFISLLPKIFGLAA